MDSPEAGWYADPAGAEATYRWWDGVGWTDWLTTDPTAASPAPPDPPGRPVVEQAAPDRSVADQPAAEPAVQGEPDGATPTSRYPPGYERRSRADGEPTEGARRAPIGRLIGAVVAALVVVAAIVVFGNRTPAPLTLPADAPSPTSTPSPTPAAQTGVDFDQDTHKVTIGTFSCVLPAAPYGAGQDVLPFPPMLIYGVDANAVVQGDYDGSHDWDASMGVGRLAAKMIKDGDANATAANVFKAYTGYAFPHQEGTPGKITIKKVTLAGADRAAVAQGHIDYKITGVSSHYDQMSVLVVKLTDGPWVGWMSSRPEKASPAVRKALQSSINSIKVG